MIFDSFDWMQGEPKLIGVDGYPTYESDPYYQQHIYLNEALQEVALPKFWWNPRNTLEADYEFNPSSWIRESQVKTKIAKEKDPFVLKTIYACHTRINWLTTNNHFEGTHADKYMKVLSGFAQNLPSEIIRISEQEIIGFIELFIEKWSFQGFDFTNKLINSINRIVTPSSELLVALKNLKKAEVHSKYPHIFNRLETCLDRVLLVFKIEIGDVWSDRLLLDLSQLEEKSKQSWQNLILHAGTADKSQPTAKWNKKAKELISEIVESSFLNFCLVWFPLVAEPRIKTIDFDPDDYFYITYKDFIPLMLHEKNCLLLKGLVWCCSNFEDSRLIPAIGLLAEACYKKIPQVGARSQSVGNACIYALSMMSGREAVTQLERLQTKIKYSQAKRLIQKAFETAAARQGITKEDLLELSVPKYGLDEKGILQQAFGSFTAEVKIQSSTKVTLQWFKPDGKPQKSLPAEVKNNCGSELKELKRNISEIESLLKIHRDRLENTYLEPRSWKYVDWKERFSTHPLLGYLTNRLVWEFSNESNNQTGIWHQNQVVNSQGKAISWINEEAKVKLWHPIFADPVLVSSWRDWLETQEIRQPFKQTYREIYPLTEAEQNTRTYSNRFAAHILRQHQMSQLMRQRGWEYNLQGGFDGANTPIFHLPQGELQAEFYVEPASEEFSDSNIYLYVASDRVCFYHRHIPIPLEEVPALVFSEVMRNVDLFVGVASIGNDPNWSDRGENGHEYNTYWNDYAFGELAMSAQLRREVITRLLPKLKISDRCKIDDRFLIVEGKKRTYKIHFGSGNILMEPNNRYLCIVPDALKASQEVFLPFEGDGVLSIILSKAFLLADDDKIKDRSILSQISS